MVDTDLRQQQLLTWINSTTSFSAHALTPVSGDASFRRYFRFQHDGADIIAVDAPPETEDTAQFLAVAKAYADAGLTVPKVYAADMLQGFYCLQDFGNRLLADDLSADTVSARYAQAWSLLPAVQSVCATAQAPLPDYSAVMVARELEIFSEWLLEKHLALVLTADQQAMLKAAYQALADNFQAQPQVGVHRDFHSRNLMILDDNTLGIIDFQGAARGPVTYDLVSLLRDCYVEWPVAQVTQWMGAYHQQHLADVSWPTFQQWCDLTGIQRHLKAAGIFARLHHRDGKSHYLKDIPRTLQYVITAGNVHPQTRELASFVEHQVLPGVLQTC